MDDLNSSTPPVQVPTERPADGGQSRTAGTAVPTPGYKTTEFWLHVLTILGVIGTSLSTASYGISRGLSKMGSSN